MERGTKIRNWLYAIALLSISICCTGALHSTPPAYLSDQNMLGNADDTLRDRAMVMLKAHMDDLRDLKNRQFIFKSGYTNPNPTVPCDYCAEEKAVKLDDYVVDVSNRYENFDFTYEITDAYNEIQVVTNQKGDYEVSINVKMTVRGLLENDNTVNKKKQKTSFLTYKFRLNYIKGTFGISEITAKQAPGADAWIVEFNPNIGISSPDYGSQEVYAVSSSSAFLAKLGVVRYFNPFDGVNAANIWLKAGARLNFLSSNVTADLLDYTNPDVPLDGGTEINPHQIDIMHDLTDVVEKKTSLLIEIPIGLSKRFRLTNSTDLSLEVEVSYSFALFTNYKTTYSLDQLGTNHLLNSDIQSESGGNPITYDTHPEAVLNTDGEVIDFFRNQSEEMNPENSNNSGYFTFSFRPTFMIRKFEVLKYSIGINLGFSGVKSDPFQIDYSYFNTADTKSVQPIHEANEASNSIFVGIIFGIKF